MNLQFSADVENAPADLSTTYDLLANITHSSAAGTARQDTTYKVHIHTRPDLGKDSKAEEKWFEMQDLIVEELNKQMIVLGSTYIQAGLPHLLFPTSWFQATDFDATCRRFGSGEVL